MVCRSLSVTVTLAVTRFAPRSADYDYDDDDDGRRVSEANIKISWTWTLYSRSPNPRLKLGYRTFHKGRRERREGGSFIDTRFLLRNCLLRN